MDERNTTPEGRKGRPPAVLRWLDPAEPGCLRRIRRAALGCGLLLFVAALVALALFLRSLSGGYVVTRALMRMDRNDAAARVAARLIARSPDNWELYRIRGLALRRAEQFDAMVETYERAEAAIPDDWWPASHHCFYGALFVDAQAALSACDRSIELQPDRPALALERRAVARAIAGDREGALADLRAAAAAREEAEDGRGGPRVASAANVDRWTVALEAGDDPFAGEALEALRQRFR